MAHRTPAQQGRTGSVGENGMSDGTAARHARVRSSRPEARGPIPPPRWLLRAGRLLHRLAREPVGVAVPALALAIMLLAPQMPDMFAGMLVQDAPAELVPDGADEAAWGFTVLGYGAPTNLRAALAFGLSATLLGLCGSYWTRAALMASRGVDDAQRRHAKREPSEGEPHAAEWAWADEWAPRAALVIAALIAAAPLLIEWMGDRSGLEDVPLLAVAIGVALVAWAFALACCRCRLGLAGTSGAWPWMWSTRTFGILAAAPLGWPLALALLLLSAAASLVVVLRPEAVEKAFATPTAAVLALALSIGPMVIALAVLRDIASVVLAALRAAVVGPTRRFLHRLSDWSLWKRPIEVEAASPIGLGLLLLCLFVLPPLFVDENDVYKIRLVQYGQAGGLKAARLDEARGPCAPRGPDEEDTRAGLRRPCITEALAAWRDARIASGHPADRPLPVVIVAAEGGASRAAAWMLSAMRMLDEQTDGAFGRHLFAISGVSGGSLGAVTYLQALRSHPRADGGLDWRHPRVNAALREIASGDLLSTSIATYFLNDTFGRFLASAAGTDRAVALEFAFERHWASPDGLNMEGPRNRHGLVAASEAGGPRLPHLLLNGTDRATGRRVITSTIRFDPADDLFAASDDLLGILGADVPAATAVTNSARFPYVSPAGRFTDAQAVRRQVLDGGYFENYGARTAAELARKVAEVGGPMNLEPIVVVVSNDAEALRGAETDEDRRARLGLRLRSAPPASPPLEEATVACPDRPRDPGAVAIGSVPLYPPHDPRRPLPVDTAERLNRKQSGRFVSELVAPLLGLYATRGAHGQDALHALRRALCPAADDGAPRRMFHLALPRPDHPGEAAPMNWVLNSKARYFLLDVAPNLVFNQRQARALAEAMQEVAEQPKPPVRPTKTAASGQ